VKTDIVLAGVGGQGVLSVAAIIAGAARLGGLQIKQGEVHGMSQRGGAVQAHMRLSDQPIHSDLIPLGDAEMVLSMEPLESLRYLPWLKPGGTVVTAVEPVRNIPVYPEMEDVVARLRSLPNTILVEADRLAREAGFARATNVVLVGAASVLLPLRPENLEECIRGTFSRKGEKIVDINLRAFRAGREAGRCVKS
jgi:indolepyruvate ferredoxin oxidoreductase beta subunit